MSSKSHKLTNKIIVEGKLSDSEKEGIVKIEAKFSIKLTDYVECCDNSHSNI